MEQATVMYGASQLKITNDELQQKIETACIKRQSMLQLKGKKMRDDECAFISGAMCALQAVFAADDSKIHKMVPIDWVIASMRGTSPFNTKKG